MAFPSFRKRTKLDPACEPPPALHNAPRHVAIIMDGNGRWAQQRMLPRIVGHHEGMKTVRKIALEASRLGVEVLTLYAFSTENWKRPQKEVEFLMRLPEEFLSTFLPDLMEHNIRIAMIGEWDALPDYTKRAVASAIERTAGNDGLVLNFALNYGSRAEMALAVQSLARDAASGAIQPEEIDEAAISRRLMTAGLPDPDLLIRTSGELRLSNFMLWQLAYAELWFCPNFWPDFDEACLRDGLASYGERNRRFGGLSGGGATS